MRPYRRLGTLQGWVGPLGRVDIRSYDPGSSQAAGSLRLLLERGKPTR